MKADGKKKKDNPLPPFSKQVMMIAGGVSMVLGLVQFARWYSYRDFLVQGPSTPPLQFEALVGFVLCGAGLFGTAMGRPRIARVGIVPACLGIVTLAQKSLGLPPGIIPLLLGPSAPYSYSLPGYFPVSSAVCLVLSGVALFFISSQILLKQRPLILAAFGSMVMALSMMSLFGYVTGISSVVGWRRLIYMDIQTSIGFQLLGLGVMAFAWRHGQSGEHRTPRWLPLPVGMCLATASLVHWQMLIAEQDVQIAKKIEYQSASLRNEIATQMQSRILALVHLAKHSESLGDARKAEWEPEASLYLSDDPSLDSIAWMDSSYRVRCMVQRKGSKLPRDFNFWPRDSGVGMALGSPRDARGISVTHSVELGQGAKGFLVSCPMTQDKGAKGFVIGVFAVQDLLDVILRDTLATGCSIAVFDKNERIYSRDHSRSTDSSFVGGDKLYAGAFESEQPGTLETRVDFHGCNWRVRTWPTREALSEMRSRFPEVVLVTGLVMACVVVLAVYSVQTATQNSKEIEAANQDLEAEIVDRRRTEEALRQSQARHRRLVESNMMGVIVASLQGSILETNDAFAKMIGYTRKELLSGRVNWREMTPPELLYLDEQAMEELRGFGVTTPWEQEYIRKDGTRVPVLVGVTLLEGSQDNCICFVLDTTERKRAEEELRREHAENELLLTAIPSILIGVDKDSKITKWNQGAETVFEIASDEAVGLPLDDCGVGWDSTEIRAHLSEAFSKDHQTALEDVRFKRPDGKEGFLGITLNPFKEPKESRSGLLVIGADITQRKILESQLRQAQKLESIGQLAAGIAHEINSPMQFINSNAHFLSKTFGKVTQMLNGYSELLETIEKGTLRTEAVCDLRAAANALKLPRLIEEIPNAIQESLEGIQRVTKILASMKDFSHPGTTKKTPADLNRAIESTITVARNEWKYVAEMITDFDPTLPHVPCWLGEFNQVILNLVVNAAHAISDAVRNGKTGTGIITVRTRQDGTWAEIRVSDTGTGIPEEFRGRIFDPFFTTKEVGRGTGQGLMIAHTVIEKHEGTINFETEVGRGTTFIIRLPIQG